MCIYKKDNGEPDAHLFQADNREEARLLVEQEVCPDGEGFISLKEISFPKPDFGEADPRWSALVENSVGLEEVMEALSYRDAFAFFYLCGFLNGAKSNVA